MFQFGFKRYQVGYASAISVVDVPDQPRLRPALPALRAAPRHSRERSPPWEATDEPTRRRSAAARAGVGCTRSSIVVVGAFIVVPLLFGVLGGFKDNGQLSTQPVRPARPVGAPSNYTDILGSGAFWRQLGNSTLIALATTRARRSRCRRMAAFVFARFAFRGRELLFTLFAIGLMFPFAVAILPLFVLLRSFDLLDNPLGVILPQAAFGLPMTIIILRSFFRTIPAEVEEAAIIDGCGPFGFFWRILLPMARPALATVSVLAIVASWNNFFLPLLAIRGHVPAGRLRSVTSRKKLFQLADDRQDGDGGQRGPGHRQQDAPEEAEGAAAVEGGRLLDLGGDGAGRTRAG